MINAENTRALMRHAMRLRQKSDGENEAGRPLFGRMPGTTTQTDKADGVLMTETRLYIGLNDAETREQKLDTQTCLEQVRNVCRNRRLPFSVDIKEGGYYHEDGEYTEETSLVLILIDADPDVVRDTARELCSLFRQECILVTEDRINGFFINNA